MSSAPTGRERLQESAVELVSNLLKDQGTILDPEAQRIIALAGNLGPQRREVTDNSHFTSSLLLFGLVESDWRPAKEPFAAAANALLSQIRGPSADQYRRARRNYFKEPLQTTVFDEKLAPARRLSGNARKLLEGASELAKRAGRTAVGPDAIAAAFADVDAGGAARHLKNMEVDLDALRKLREGAIADNAPLPSGTPNRTFITQVRTDDPRASAEDLLKVADEVGAFANLISGRKILPPLSIGIFGEWGSGKTFFMERLFDAVEDIRTKVANEAPEMFHSEIVQIRFNAWHYIETNLWASLVEYIFRELDSWLRGNEKDVEALFDQLSTSKQLRLDAARDLIEQRKSLRNAEANVTETRSEYDLAVKNRAKAPLADVWTAAARTFTATIQEQDQKELKQAAVVLGVPTLVESSTGLAQLIRDSRGQGDRARVIGNSLLHRLGSTKYLLPTVIVVLLIPVLAEWLRYSLGSITGAAWVSQFHTGVLAVASILTVLTVAGRAFLRSSAAALNVLDRFQSELEEAVADATKTQHDSVAEAEEKVVEVRHRLEEAERRLADASERVAAAEQDYQNDTARGRLNRFIREKVADGGYAKHLGLVATIRRDFGQLAQIMGSLEKHELGELDKSNKLYEQRLDALLKDNPEILSPAEQADLRKAIPPTELRYFSRIVLYIDDLDRCPPDKVADVLQAIHMLLFFPLFVVVVAVDARWITRSLETEFPHLLVARPPKIGPIGSSPLTLPLQQASIAPATALDYLEKIFTIPFWVRPMDEESSIQFVGGLTKGSVRANDTPTPPNPAPPVPPNHIPPAPPNPTPPAPPNPTPPAPDVLVPIRVVFESTPLTEDEAAMLARFAPFLGGSPRRAKRFVNLYQLLKTSLKLAGTQATAPEYASSLAVIAMLAIVTGAPRSASEFFRALSGDDGRKKGPREILEGLSAKPEASGNDLDRLRSILQEWIGITSERTTQDSVTMDALHKFAKTTRRYSFEGPA